MNLLVTGAAGFIGYHTVRRLLEEGHSVFGIDNLNSSSDCSLKTERLKQLGINAQDADEGALCNSAQWQSLYFLKADITNAQGMNQLCADNNFDCIIHLAATSGSLYTDFSSTDFAQNNIQGTLNMLEAARINKVPHFFFTSSYIVHGDKAKSPVHEDDDLNSPLSIYAATKRAAELLCYSYSRSYDLPVSIFRLFTVYGPWGRPGSIPMELAESISKEEPITLFNNGHLIRDFAYIDDIVDGIISVLSSPPYKRQGNPAYQLFNVGRSKPVPLMAFIQSLENALMKPAVLNIIPDSPLLHGEPVEAYADTSKLEAELAYSPVWDHEEAVPLFAQWFKKYMEEKA